MQTDYSTVSLDIAHLKRLRALAKRNGRTMVGTLRMLIDCAYTEESHDRR